MSTDPGRLSQLDTFHSLSMPSSGLAPGRGAVAWRLRSRLHDLSIVVERLFTFYEAMRTGKPVADGDEMLAQVRTALARSTMSRDGVR
jgi:hypothetical protein